MTKRMIMTTARRSAHVAVVSLATALMLAGCSASDDDSPTVVGTASAGVEPQYIDGRMVMTVGVGSGAPADGDVAATLITRGNGYDDATNSTFTNGDANSNRYQNQGELHSRNYARVGLFTLKSGNTSVTDPSWEKFNVRSSSSTQLVPNQFTLLSTPTYGVNQLFYPDQKEQQVDVYGYAPATGSTNTTAEAPDGFSDISSHEVTYTLKTDQTAEADYIDSDVLWGRALSSEHAITAQRCLQVQHSGNPGVNDNFYKQDEEKVHVLVPLQHRGAKVVVRLNTENMPMAVLKNAVVQVNVPHITGKLNISNGTFVADAGETGGQTAVTLTSRLGITAAGPTPALEGAITSDGTATTNESEVAYYTCAGVIVPQTYEATALNDLFSVTLYAATTAHTDGGNSANPPTATYSWRPTGVQLFQSGKQYVYTITLSAQGLSVKSFVTDWDATPTQQRENAQQDTPQIGDLYFSDGTYGSKEEYPSKTPIGIVFSTETSETDKGLGYHHGYVMALKNAASGVAWSSAAPAAIYTESVQSDRTVPATMASETRAEMEGLSNSLALAANPGGLTYAANAAARSYTPAAPVASSGWFLPSIGQLMKIADTFNGSTINFRSTSGGNPIVGVWDGDRTAVTVLNNINTYVSNRLANTSDYEMFENGTRMWSSTVSSNNKEYAWQFIYEGTTTNAVCVYGCTYHYAEYSRVRPVLAF